MKTIFHQGAAVLLTGILLTFPSCAGRDSRSEDLHVSDTEIEEPAEYSKNEEKAPSSRSEGYSEEEYDMTMTMAGSANMAEKDVSIVNAPPKYFSSIAAVESDNFPDKKFIRTAEMRFKVQNVMRSSFEIEDDIARLKGYVSYTHMNSNVQSRTRTKISEDSSLVVTKYSLENQIVIRVPNTKLDTALKKIAEHIEFLDYRTVTADDVTLTLLASKLEMARLERHNNRLSKSIDSKGKKLESIESAEQSILDKETERDEAYIEELETKDRIAYSAITLYLYQDGKVIKELVANEESIKGYERGFWKQVGDGLIAGWKMVEAIFIGLAHIWFFLLIAIFSIVYVMRYIKRTGKKQ